MKKATAPTHAQDKRDTMRKLRDQKTPSSRQIGGHVAELNAKNQRNVLIKRNADDSNHGSKIAGRVLKPDPELEKLRCQVEERDKEIAALRQAAKVKDRKLDQLTNRCRKEQMRQYFRFMELEPVAELEEDSCGGGDSPTSSGPPSLSPPPCVGDPWVEDAWVREHLELQHRCQVLESRLRKSEARAGRLHELRRAATDHAQQLQAEAVELREHSELLEFRVLELEEAQHYWSSRSPGPDTRDVCTDTESDDVSDSGVTSLPTSEEGTSDTDLGVHDLKMDLPHDELRDRLVELARTTACLEDKCCLHQVVTLLDDLASSPIDLQDSLTGKSYKSLPDCTTANNDFFKTSSRIVATVLPFTELSQTPMQTEEILKDIVMKQVYTSTSKHLKNAECLQESGIFESESMECATQTEGPSVSGDLSAEIQKLTQFRERIENKNLLSSNNANELAFCRERLQLLEAKVLVYESSGDRQARLLAERLQREVVLAAQVKELSGKVARLQADTLRLEEERCEYEEAENDTRLRCQKLEVKMQALSDKKSELQSLLQQERRSNTTLRNELSDCERLRRDCRQQVGYLETLVAKLEQRNYELEERAMELRHRLELEEGAWPVLLLWGAWKALAFYRNSRLHRPLALAFEPHRKDARVNQSAVVEHGKELADEGQSAIGERQEAEGMATVFEIEEQSKFREKHTYRSSDYRDLQKAREEVLGCTKRIRELEQQLLMAKGRLSTRDACSAVKQKSRLVTLSKSTQYSEEITESSNRFVETAHTECIKRLDELTQTEIDLKNRITELEQKETAFMETLRQADDLWSDLESGYKQQIQKMHENASRQSDEALELEQAVADLQAALRRTEDEKAATGAKVAQLSEALAVADASMERLQQEVDIVLKPKLSQERRLSADLQKDLAHKNETLEAMQDSYDSEIEILKCQLAAVRKEYMHANCECEQLKDEVHTLENTIQEQRDCLTRQEELSESALVRLTNELGEKERELQNAMMARRDCQTRSARDEIAEADARLEEDVQMMPPPRARRAVAVGEEDTSKVRRIVDKAVMHSKECASCSKVAVPAIQAILSQVRVLNELMSRAHKGQAEVPQQKNTDDATKGRLKSRGKFLEEQIEREQESHRKQGREGKDVETERSVKPDFQPSNPDVHQRTEEELNCREVSTERAKVRPVSSDLSRSIFYWDDIDFQKNNAKIKLFKNRLRAIGRNQDGGGDGSPAI